MGFIRNRLALRLALLFGAIVLGSIAVIFFYVVPQLESTLREEKLRSLETDARDYSQPVIRAIANQATAKRLDIAVRTAADRSNARVTLLAVGSRAGAPQVFVRSDSTTQRQITDLDFQVAHDSVVTRHTTTGWESSNEGRVGEAARPLRFNKRISHVIVFSAPLTDVQSNVALIRRRILVAGAMALVFALLGGYGVARWLTLRVRRIERAAEKVSRGDFSETIPVDSSDELGQLAIAFNEMQRQLAQLDSARKRFIAVASHELRTPLFSLGGFVELLQDEELDEETRHEFLGQMRDQVDRLTVLATELLDLSRLEAGSLELRPEQVDLGELARSVAGEFTPAVSRHHSQVSLDLAEHEIDVTCDPERVAQIVRILLDNALTHTPDGTDIVVSTARENGLVRLAVRDSGPGIKRTSVERIFEPFYTSDDAQGSGLGLAIARDLAERMDGRLAVDPTPGATTFTLELPT
jgi:signal transduction histidine kinase